VNRVAVLPHDIVMQVLGGRRLMNQKSMQG